VLRFLAQLDADEDRRGALNSGQYVMQQAFESGLVTHDEYSMSSLTEAVDRLVLEDAVKLEDTYPERRRQGEALSPNRFYNCRNIEITLRGYEVIESLNLLAPPIAPAPEAPSESAAHSMRGRHRKRFLYKRGDRFGRWSLVSQLGSGGNGEVWEAEDAETGDVCAIKILHADSTDSERYRRFRREIETLSQLGVEDAVLPLVDFDLPEDLSAVPAWYTMPVARNIRVALAGKPVLECVAAAREIADALARLVERQIHHRDVKPENLYSHGGRYVLGDFGLVTRPDDEKLTRPNHIPGPGAYMPSEAFVRWDEADFEKIDVFCLAKSLWVVITRADFPPRGRINADDRYALVRQFPDEHYIAELDQLIERTTADDPTTRPTLAGFAQAVGSWLGDRELRVGMIESVERDLEVEVHVKRFVVAHARRDRGFGAGLLDLSTEADVVAAGLRNDETAAGLVRLRDQGDVSGDFDPLHPAAPEWWSQLWPAAHLVDEVDGRDVIDAQVAPLLRALHREALPAIHVHREQESVEIAGLGFDPAEAYFRLRYANERGYLTYREMRESTGVLLSEPRVTGPGLRLIAAPSLASDPRLPSWMDASRARFESESSKYTTPEEPQLFPDGFWEFGYALTDMPQMSLRDLRETLMIARSHWSGWAMWLVIPEAAPYPIDGTIECWLGAGANLTKLGPSSNDYWRASPDGRLYIVRGYEDDDPAEHRGGGTPGETLDILLPIWRAAEGLLHASRLARLLGTDESTVTFTARWGGLNDRRLTTWSAPGRVPFSTTFRSRQFGVESTVVARAKEIPDSLESLVGALLAPLYEVFDFFTPAESLVRGEVEKILELERNTT
jgi:hypothetical protein